MYRDRLPQLDGDAAAIAAGAGLGFCRSD